MTQNSDFGEKTSFARKKRSSTVSKEKLKKEHQLDEAWIRYNGFSEDDEAAINAVLYEMYRLAYELYPDKEEYIGEFYIKRFNKYDPSRGNTFSKYMFHQLVKIEDYKKKMAAGYSRKTVTDPETGKKKREFQQTVLTRTDLYSNDNDQDIIENDVPDPDGMQGFDDVGESIELFCVLLSYIVSLPERLHGRANNPVKHNLFTMFYTESVASLMKKETNRLPLYRRHERDLFDAMKLSFLDYFMQDVCRTVYMLSIDPLKKEADLFEGGRNREATIPLHRSIYITYLAKFENYSVSPPAITQQRNDFKERVDALFKQHKLEIDF